MIKNLDGYDIHTAIRILERVIELIPEYEFVCHCIDHIERRNEFGLVNKFIFRHLREEIEERLNGIYTYTGYLVSIGELTEEQQDKLTIEQRKALRVKWVRSIIEELPQ
jgi:hypothetical protein